MSTLFEVKAPGVGDVIRLKNGELTIHRPDNKTLMVRFKGQSVKYEYDPEDPTLFWLFERLVEVDRYVNVQAGNIEALRERNKQLSDERLDALGGFQQG